jgi:hypothetical protein
VHAPSLSGQRTPASDTPTINPWLDHLGRGMYLRGHISVYAAGSVTLLALNLMRGSGGVWADTAIGAWGMLVVVHGILLIIARLLQELMAEDEEEPIRPASEMRWQSPSTWTLPPRTPDQAARREPQPSVQAETDSRAPDRDTADTERVSWQAATNAAWLAPKDPSSEPGKNDDRNDFTPLKFD